MNQVKVMDESASMVLSDGEDMCFESELIEHEMVKDNLNYEFVHISHGTIKDDPDSIDSFSTIETHVNEALGEDLERSNESEPKNQQKYYNGSVSFCFFDGVNIVQMNQTKMMDVTGSMVLLDGVDNDLGIKSESVEKTTTPEISKDKEIHMNLRTVENLSAAKNLFDSLDGKDFEFYTPDKENKNPNACSGKSLSAVNHDVNAEKVVFGYSQNLSATDEGVNRELSEEVLASSEKEVSRELSAADEGVDRELCASDEGVNRELFASDRGMGGEFSAADEGVDRESKVDLSVNYEEVLASSQKEVNRELFAIDVELIRELFATDEGMNRETKVDSFVNFEELLASSVKENESEQIIVEESCNSVICPQTVQKAVKSSQDLAKKRWTMVVDTSSLLDNKSLKSLKLLEGLKGTQLFVPKIVVSELMDIKSQDNFFKRNSKKVSLALKWIDECMINTRWWICEDDEIVHSSPAVSEVLNIALHLRKETMNKKIIILSNNHTLKIKAMAEGIMCEAAEDFHKSLVNPFSERFMWVGSSARGLTWSCVDDDDYIVRQKYHGSSSNGSYECKGLKFLARASRFTK